MVKNKINILSLRNKFKSIIKKKSNEKTKTSFTMEEAIIIAKKLNINFEKEKFTIEQFKKGLNVELEHGSKLKKTDVTGDNPIITGKIALAHLNEIPDYYERLKKLEEDAKVYWSKK